MNVVKSTGEAAELFRQGFALHQRGQLLQARALYEQVLARQPSHVDALHMLGVLHLQANQFDQALVNLDRASALKPDYAVSYNRAVTLQGLGRLDEAIADYDRAIALKPDCAEAHSNRGSTLVALRRFDEAMLSLDRAIALKPDYADAYNNRGNALKEQQRISEALACFDRAIALKPDFAQAFNNRGNALKQLNRRDEAIRSYDLAIAIDSRYAHAYNNRGMVLQDLQRYRDALASYNQAIALMPDLAAAHFNRGNSLQALGRGDEAVASFDRAIALKPDYTEAHNNRGSALLMLQRFDDALASYDRAIALKPDYTEAHNNRGNALLMLQRFDDALASYDRALTLRPEYVEAYSNRGNILQELNRFDDALASYDRAIAIDPDYADAHWNKALALLLHGRFTPGWALHECRWKRSGAPSSRDRPLWLGKEAIAGQTILLHAEQGLGDSIQFGRYAKSVSELGASVMLEVQAPLVGLLAGLEGVSQVIARGQALPDFDCHCPLLSLPLAFGTTLDNIPSPGPYLRSDPDKLASWSERLGAKTRPRIGLVWSGNRDHKNDRNRSLPLSTLIGQLPPTCEYLSLQKDVSNLDQVALEQSAIRHFGEDLRDFTDTAALCDLMDVVLSVDTSVAHLAGALGRPTWVLLPYSPDWRWLLNRDDSPWYRSVRLCRQGEDRLWGPVLQRVAKDLAALSR